MEPEGSLPHLQVPASCPSPKPDQSSPCPPSHFLKNHLIPGTKSHVPCPLLRSYRRISPGPWHVYMFRDYASFYGEELLAPRPTPSWSTTHFWLSATAYPTYSQLPSILEAIPPSATWGRTMPWWQGPIYHGPLECKVIVLCDQYRLSLSADRAFVLVDGPVQGICSTVEQKEPECSVDVNPASLSSTEFGKNWV